MTIVQPNKANLTAMNILMVVMMMFLIATALAGMFIYNQLVNFRHDILSAEDNISKAGAVNSDLKTSLYELTNTKDPSLFAQGHALVQDNNPQYLQGAAQVSANQ